MLVDFASPPAKTLADRVRITEVAELLITEPASSRPRKAVDFSAILLFKLSPPLVTESRAPTPTPPPPPVPPPRGAIRPTVEIPAAGRLSGGARIGGAADKDDIESTLLRRVEKTESRTDPVGADTEREE